MLGGEARDRVAGFWRALDETPPAEPDHLSVMLALYARLVEMEESETDGTRRESWRGARRAFLWEHLLSWLPVYLDKLSETAVNHFYRRWGEILTEALYSEARRAGAQTQLPVHLREATALGLVDPRSGEVEDFLQSLLTPVRSGMILVRFDLSQAARRLGLGLRLGERKFILKALFGQDSAGVLKWLEAEALRWAGRHSRRRGALGAAALAWEEKALASANLLKELGRAAQLEQGSVQTS
jgi:hypothetical protein